MANPVNEVPVVVDYTSRDFYSLRDDLVARVRSVLPKWSGDSPADFGIAMVEAFSYMGDVVNYYIDRVANENYLATATQRQSVLNIARNYGYTPTGFRAASVTVQFTNEDTSDVILPVGTQLLSSVTTGESTFDLIWTLEEEVTVPAAVGESLGIITSTALQYEDVSKRPENAANGENDIDGELIAVSNGFPEQFYQLTEAQVVDGSVRIWVQNGLTFEPWTEVTHLTDYGQYDQVFSTISDANDFTYVQFGDGISGAIPTKFSTIKTAYNIGDGEGGNVATNLVNELYRVPGLTDTEVSVLSSTLTVTNPTSGVGGSSPESNESIKAKAPEALTALNRAVSLKDYASLAVQVLGVGKAKAVADTWTSVTVYVAPQRNASSVDQFPGYTDLVSNGGALLPEWYSIQTATEEFFADKVQIGTSVTVSPPTYVPVAVEVFYTKLEQYTETALETSILKVLLDVFKYSNIEFGQVVHPEEVETAVRAIPGIINARVVNMYRAGATAERAILIAEPDELFVALSDDIVVTPYSTNSYLQTLTSSLGTFTPGFSPTYLNYSLTIPNGTVSITMTPTVQAASARLRINGVLINSGSVNTVNTPVGNTTVTFGVAAADGLTFTDYTVVITRVS